MQAQNTHLQENFKRTMKVRHLVMLSLGGIIGAGLFLIPAILFPPLARLVRYWLTWSMLHCAGEHYGIYNP